MIDPRSQYIFIKIRKTGRMLLIERKLAAKARGGCKATEQPWYSSTVSG